MGPEHRTLVHDSGLVGLETINLLLSGVQIGPVPFQTPAVSVPSLLERLCHGLLVHDQVGDHFFHAACQGHSSLDAPSELNPPQRIPSPLSFALLVPQAEG